MVETLFLKMKTHSKVSVIIPFFRNLNDLEVCLRSLSESDFPIDDIVIIDNGCTERGIENLVKLSPASRLFKENENKGFAGAVNKGIRLAKDDADLFWIINSDIVIEKDSMRNLVETLDEDDSIGIAGSKLYSYDDKDILLGCGGYINWRNLSCYQRGCGERDAGQYNVMQDADYIPGCSLMVRRKTIEDVGAFDEKFFMYFEDVDICMRARQRGYRVVYAPYSKVFHRERSFEKGRHSELFCYYITRNSLYFFNAYGRIRPFDFIKWASINMRSNATSMSRIFCIFKGMLDFMLKKKGSLYAR